MPGEPLEQAVREDDQQSPFKIQDGGRRALLYKWTKVLKIAVCAKGVLFFTDSKTRPNFKYWNMLFFSTDIVGIALSL